MKWLLIFTLVGLVVLCSVTACAETQFSIAPRVGYNLDAENPLVGVGLQFSVSEDLPLTFNPSAEYIFSEIDDATILQIDANVNYFFSVAESGIFPFVGGGLGIFHTTVGSFKNTEIGLNLIGGVEFRQRRSKRSIPFALARLTLREGSIFSIIGGMRFTF